jgi:aconitase A
MGVLRLPPMYHPTQLDLKPDDTISIGASQDQIGPRAPVPVRITRAAGGEIRFDAIAAIETSLEVEILKAGDMLPYILSRSLAATPKEMSA